MFHRVQRPKDLVGQAERSDLLFRRLLPPRDQFLRFSPGLLLRRLLRDQRRVLLYFVEQLQNWEKHVRPCLRVHHSPNQVLQFLNGARQILQRLFLFRLVLLGQQRPLQAQQTLLQQADLFDDLLVRRMLQIGNRHRRRTDTLSQILYTNRQTRGVRGTTPLLPLQHRRQSEVNVTETLVHVQTLQNVSRRLLGIR